jgi:hypothetical protein
MSAIVSANDLRWNNCLPLRGMADVPNRPMCHRFGAPTSIPMEVRVDFAHESPIRLLDLLHRGANANSYAG